MLANVDFGVSSETLSVENKRKNMAGTTGLEPEQGTGFEWQLAVSG
jgi:hypothetical protein